MSRSGHALDRIFETNDDQRKVVMQRAKAAMFSDRMIGRLHFTGSTRTYLNALVLAVLLPLLALASLLAMNFARSQQQIIEAQRSDVVDNLTFLIDREIESIKRGLQVLSVSPDLVAGRLERFRLHLGAALPFGGRVALYDRQGSVLVSPPQAPTDMPQSAALTAHLQAVFAGKATVSGILPDAAQRLAFVVSVPVMVDGRPNHALSAEIGADRLQGLFIESKLKPSWLAAIADRDGFMLARSAGSEQFSGRRVPFEAFAAATGSQQTGVFENISMDGIKTSTAYQRSEVTGWTLYVAVPTQILRAALTKTYSFMAVIGIGLTALSLGLAYWLANRIAAAAHKLETAALDVVEGRDVAATHYPVTEFGHVAKVFEYASAIAGQQKLDERRLKESEERQRLAIEAGSFATWDLDVQSGQWFWSPTLYAFFGYTETATPPPSIDRWIERVHPDDRSMVLADFESARTEHRNSVAEYRIFRADTHEMRWFRSNGQFHYDHDGQATRIVGVVRDVTERKVMELALRENETRYRSALTVGRMGSWETNFVSGLRIWSPEGQVLFGLALPDGIGRVDGDNDEFLNALHPDDKHTYEKLHQLAQSTDSFPAEYRIIRRDGAMVWLSGRGQVFARSSDGKCQRLVSVMADVTEQKKAEEHVRFLLREMSHRSKNLLAVIQSIATQTMRTSGSMAEFHKRFEQRLHGLAASHDILVDQNWEGAQLSGLVQRQLAPFIDHNSPRLRVSGCNIDLSSTAAQAVGLALHELATNAVKYGALSEPNGHVTVSWAFAEGVENPPLVVSWIEGGGPSVAEPLQKGFGSAVIERLAPSSVGGSVALQFLPAGFQWRLTIPAAALIFNDETLAHLKGSRPTHESAV